MDDTKQAKTRSQVIGVAQSREAYLRALPELLANPKYDRWSVAYCGEKRVALATTQLEVVQECNRLGLREDEIYIGCVCPQSDHEEEIETGLFEFEDIEE